MTQVQHTTASDFEEDVINSSTPVLVDFWAEWCGPCKAMTPALDALAQETAEEWKIVKINVDEQHELSEKYEIRSLPTLLVFKNKEVIAQHIGAASKAQIQALMDDNS